MGLTKMVGLRGSGAVCSSSRLGSGGGSGGEGRRAAWEVLGRNGAPHDARFLRRDRALGRCLLRFFLLFRCVVAEQPLHQGVEQSTGRDGARRNASATAAFEDVVTMGTLSEIAIRHHRELDLAAASCGVEDGVHLRLRQRITGLVAERGG